MWAAPQSRLVDPDVTQEWAGRATLIGVLFLGSLLRDQKRQLKGGGVEGGGGGRVSNRDSCFTTANSHARSPGKPRYASTDVCAQRSRVHSRAARRQRHFGVREVRGRLCSDRVTVAEPRPFPVFPAPREHGDRDRAVVVRACAHATTARMAHKKMAARVWRDRRECSVVWSPGEVPSPPGRIWRTARAHGSGSEPSRSRGVH